MSAVSGKRIVPVKLQVSYKKAEVIALQLAINEVELELSSNPLPLELKLDTMYYFRWYFAGNNGAKVVFRFRLPSWVRLRYPFVPADKVKPEIEASIGNHPLIRDTSDDQRFYLQKKEEES